ncbi:28S rRNA (uridine-N(3))-methyltransferase isoform X2 [Oratosquilla oratoria]
MEDYKSTKDYPKKRKTEDDFNGRQNQYGNRNRGKNFQDGSDKMKWKNSGYEEDKRWRSDGNANDSWHSKYKEGTWQSKKLYKKQLLRGENYEEVKAPGPGRKYTVSIAVPASILEDTCLKDELRTYVIGQLARAANIYSVDEIVVYDDGCWRRKDATGSKDQSKEWMDMMCMLLEYQECPQYLRKHLFDYHPFLRKVGVLNALNAPHHLRSNQWCEYREGVVLDRGDKLGSYVDVGLPTEVTLNRKLQAGLRVTIKLDPEAIELKKPHGTVVSPDEPREVGGYYWGYTVRMASSLCEVLTDSRFKDGYDLLIGTSDKGESVSSIAIPEFEHALILFGGVEGLEAALEEDDALEATDPRDLCNLYVNTCPQQQARTIRTEEAVLISLCVLQDKLVGAAAAVPDGGVNDSGAG